MKLHALAGSQDLVTGEFTTRCGLKSLRLPHGGFDKFELADDENSVTCPDCQANLTEVEKKCIRLMHDHLEARMIHFRAFTARFEFRRDKDLTLYTPGNPLDRLQCLKLIQPSIQHGWKLTRRGELHARTLSEVKDEFDEEVPDIHPTTRKRKPAKRS